MKANKSTLIFLAGLCGAMCFPLAYVIVGSLTGQAQIAEYLSGMFDDNQQSYAAMPLVPAPFSIESYVEILVDTPAFFTSFWNTVVVVGSVVCGQLVIGALAAWGFARYDFPLKKPIFVSYIVLMVLPFQATMLSQYLVLHNLGLDDTLFAIVLPGIFAVFPVLIIYHFFSSLPKSTIDAARLDGASEVQILLKIGVPHAAPGIFSAMMLTFFEFWNLVEQPLVFLNDRSQWPLSLFVQNIQLNQIGIAFASAAISAIPALFIFFAGRRYFDEW